MVSERYPFYTPELGRVKARFFLKSLQLAAKGSKERICVVESWMQITTAIVQVSKVQ